MPRILDPVLLQALDRANPNVAAMVEVNAPDVANVLRRSDQFLAPVSQTPANAIVADAAGALTLAATPAGATLASFTHTDDYVVAVPRTGLGFDHNNQTEVRSLCWLVDQSFGRGVLQSVSIPIRRYQVWVTNNLLLYIYRRRSPGNGLSVFEPILSAPARWKNTPAAWAGGGLDATAVFEFDDQDVEVGVSNVPPITLTQGGASAGEDQAYYFVLQAENASRDDLFNWPRDLTSARTIAGVGTFVDRRWFEYDGTVNGAWLLDGTIPATPRVPCATIVLKSYPATVQAVYPLDLGQAPASGSAGRVVFERGGAAGSSASLELATAGSGGPWTGVKDGDALSVAQQLYWIRATLTASANGRVAPMIAAMGVEFLTTTDASAEAIVDPLPQQVDVPFLAAGVGEGSVTLLRTGQRDYHDVASDLTAATAASQLEVEVRLGSRHPLVTRDKWLLTDRAFVNNREPAAAGEQFNLLSYLKLLKQKIPQRAETINTVHTVTAATTTAVSVTPALPAVNGSNAAHAYGTPMYMRVRQSSQTGVSTGYVQTIDDNTGPNTLAFNAATPLPGTLVAGDVIEVHSGQYAQNPLIWQDADPADVWWEILTVHCAIPAERIGRADLGTAQRSGLPPRVTDRAPGDAVTQTKLTVTLKIGDPEEASGLIDQLSFLMGGCTVEIGGQICFRQIYPLRDASGAIVVPPEPIAATFDVRNMAGLSTPVGLEQRIPSLACDYGVNTTAVGSDTPAAETVNYVDADAIAWLEVQPVDDLATAAIDSKIARWCYNSVDAGLYLASMLSQQVVRAGSTGLRVWTWNATEQQPQLVVGDRVTVITDQYTDYDPSAQRAIRGWWAFPLVLVSVAGGGRQFRGYMLGLTEAVQLRGGPGTLAPDPFAAHNNTILRYAASQSADGTQAIVALEVGAAVDSVHAYYRTVPVETDPDLAGDFSNGAALDVDGTKLGVPENGAILFTGASAFPQPARGKKLVIRFVPWYFGNGIYIEGENVPVVIDAAPPGINVQLHADRTGAVVSLSGTVKVGPSDVPGSLSIIETVLGEDTTILTIPRVTGDLDLEPDTYPELANRAIAAGVEKVTWRAQYTDVAEQTWKFGEVTALPARVDVHATPSEAAGVGTITAVITDSGNYLDPMHVDGSVVAAVSWHVIALGNVTIVPSTTAPGGGATSGTYTLDVTEDPLHPIQVAGFVHYVDGSTACFGTWTFDSDKIANVLSAVASIANQIATYVCSFDTDTVVGTGKARYRVDGGSWTTFDVTAAYGGTFSFTMSGALQSVDVQAQSADGSWGPSLTVPLSAYNSAKSIRIGAPDFTYGAGPAISQQLGYLCPATTGSLVAYATMKGVPVGATITTFSARLYRETGVGNALLQIYRIDTNGVAHGPISGSVLTHTTTGWQTVSVSVTETTDGSVYYLYVTLEQLSEPHNTSVRCAYAEADYTAPDISKPGAG